MSPRRSATVTTIEEVDVELDRCRELLATVSPLSIGLVRKRIDRLLDARIRLAKATTT